MTRLLPKCVSAASFLKRANAVMKIITRNYYDYGLHEKWRIFGISESKIGFSAAITNRKFPSREK